MRTIRPTGLADREGSLREGDEVMEVNGTSLGGCTHKESANIIRVCVVEG